MSKVRVTLNVQFVITSENDQEYLKKLDQILEKLEKEFGYVDIESEDELP